MQIKISFICLMLFIILASFNSQARAGSLEEETTRAQNTEAQTNKTQITTRANSEGKGFNRLCSDDSQCKQEKGLICDKIAFKCKCKDKLTWSVVAGICL